MSGRRVGAPERMPDVGRAAPFFQPPIGTAPVAALIDARQLFQAICGHLGAAPMILEWARSGIELINREIGDRP